MVGTEILGLIGATLIAIAYIPQIRHIIKEHCTGGVSLRAWLIWLIGTILILIHALTTEDLVFKIIEIVSLIAVLVILICIKVYGKRVCHSKEKKIAKMNGKKR